MLSRSPTQACSAAIQSADPDGDAPLLAAVADAAGGLWAAELPRLKNQSSAAIIGYVDAVALGLENGAAGYLPDSAPASTGAAN